MGEIVHFPHNLVGGRQGKPEGYSHTPVTLSCALGDGVVVGCARKIPLATPVHHSLIVGEMEEIFENKIANILKIIYWIALPFSQCVLITVYY